MPPRYVTHPSDALEVLGSGQRVFIHSAAAAPAALVGALAERLTALHDVEIVHLHTEGAAPYAGRALAGHARVNALFVGANVREALGEGRADYTPIFLSEIPALFSQGVLPLDVALVQVSPPDRHGYCSLGVSVDVTRAAVRSAKHVIAQVNRYMPRTHGDGFLSVSELDALVSVDEPIHEHVAPPIDDVERAIGRRVSELVEDGATIQVGIGAVPNAILAALEGHRDLGVHTEMFSDGMVHLVERGVITNARKRIHAGKTVATFVVGSRRVYDFVDDNPSVNMLDVAYVNNPDVIRRNEKVVAINSAIEIDLTGQVCADSIGTYQYSGVGGQMDFMRGAALSEGGRPIIALTSTTRLGVSRIVPTLKDGAGVITTRAHVHWVVTEYGAVDLHGMSLRRRAIALVGLAHPSHREALQAAVHARFDAH